MNDKDKEAFEKWELDVEWSTAFKSHRVAAYEAWQAACEYRQKEIDELLMDKDLHKETVIELKSKINELETFIRADAISTNWENKEFQEATRYNWLDDEIRRVEHHNFNLQTENVKLRKCVEFYADIISWDKCGGERIRIKDDDIYPMNNLPFGGKRARQVLKELDLY